MAWIDNFLFSLAINKRKSMRVVRIIENTPIINEDNDWLLFCMVQRGNNYVYGAIVCSTKEEAFSIEEGQHLDIEKTKFNSRIKVV